MLTYPMERRSEEAKYIYLYRCIRDDIRSGQLDAGAKLPSKRALAEHLGVSVITVEHAYGMLEDEGYLESRERSGYYVRCPDRPALRPPAAQSPIVLLDEPQGEPGGRMYASAWFKTVRRVISEHRDRLLEKPPNAGCAVLRNAIAEYLLRYRGMHAQPERIIIGSGAEHLYGMVAHMLGPGLVYAIEDPSYVQIRMVYEGAGAHVEALPMGPDGIDSGALAASRADLLHVTPFHSHPTGVTASYRKRCEYLEWAQERGAFLVEDDFDSEFFMPGGPIETLYALDRQDSVIYLNTFSQSLAPSMRMGYMILPERLLPVYRETLSRYSCTVPTLEQYALAEFIASGQFERHLSRRRSRKNGGK